MQDVPHAAARAGVIAGAGGARDGERDDSVDLSEIYNENYRSLVRFLYRRTGDQALAEDLAQEAFVRAIEHQPAQPRAWLYQVAANLVRDDFRRRAVRRRHLELVGDERGAVPAAAAPDIAYQRSETIRRVRAALAELTPTDRDGLLLHEEGLSYEEIAEVLGLSKGSVGTTLSRARARLAAAYEKLETTGSQRDAAH
jgi:RNA polymerase sigma-70 factor (ECF subfamily)